MSARQVARDLRYVAADLGWAVVKVSVDGLASGVSWWMARRQPAPLPSGAEALTKAEEAIEVFEPMGYEPPQWIEWGNAETRDAAAETGGLDICTDHGTVLMAGLRCPECDYECGRPVPGPGVVPTPTPGQPVFADHVKALLDEHIARTTMFSPVGWFCDGDGCDWRGSLHEHNDHLASLIGELVAAETRIAQKLRAAGEAK